MIPSKPAFEFNADVRLDVALHEFIVNIPDQCHLILDRMSISFEDFGNGKMKVQGKLSRFSLFNVTIRRISFPGT